MRRDLVMALFGKLDNKHALDWFRARRRHSELRLAGPKGKLP